MKQNKLLTQNSKMKKTAKLNDVMMYNWTLPAFKSQSGVITCPMASKCVKGCYAKQGAYIWSKVKAKHERNLVLSQSDQFVGLMIDEIKSILKRAKGRQVYIRIHDSGDFYNADYVVKWFEIMYHFENVANIQFYAYTKQVRLFKSINPQAIPSNFEFIYSYGGKEDALIDVETDRHALVFESKSELILKGYINASSDDLLAINSNCRKIGLVYHGTKSFKNTTWDRVKAA